MHAQNEKVTKVKYSMSGGLLGAVNLSEFRTDNDANTRVDYNSRAGWAFGGWLNFPVTSGFSIEPQLMYSSLRFHTNNTNTGLLLYDGKLRYISVPVLLKFSAGEAIGITVGPQIDFLASSEDNNNVAVNDDFKKTSLGLSAGLELFPHKAVSLFGRYVFGLSNADDRTNHSATMDYKIQNLQFGLKFRLFGGKKTETAYKATETTVVKPLDTDGDGITDDVDKCPTVAGLPKYNGCPIPDTDGDGINDELDKCPTVAGTAKYDGCPIPDSDGDGINDEEDKCPNQAGPKERMGCPVTDKDNDGVNDDEDKCPDIAGTAANNGCPDVPANVTKSLGMAADDIHFGTGVNNTKLTAKSNAALDKVVAMLNENPNLKLRIEGHTDNSLDETKSMKLTEDRVAGVKAYIVSKGISEDRIITEGFGGTQPVADNKTAAGRAKNNRIELRMVY